MGIRTVVTASERPQSHPWLRSPRAWLGAMLNAIQGALGLPKNVSIPAPNRVGAPLPPEPQGSINPGQRQILYLLCCMQAGDRGYGRRLHQALTPSLHNDEAFFALLRSVYYANRKMTSRFTLRAVSEVGHCKVRFFLPWELLMQGRLNSSYADVGRLQRLRLCRQTHRRLRLQD